MSTHSLADLLALVKQTSREATEAAILSATAVEQSKALAAKVERLQMSARELSTQTKSDSDMIKQLTAERDNLAAYKYVKKAEQLADFALDWLYHQRQRDLTRAVELAKELRAKNSDKTWALPEANGLVGNGSFNRTMSYVITIHFQLDTENIDMELLNETAESLDGACDEYLEAFEQSEYSKL